MGDGFTPRAVLIVVMLLLLPVGMYHRVKSQSTREALDRRQEGVFILATLRPLGAALWLGVIAWMINPALIVVALSLVAANWFFFVAGMALLCLLVVRTRTEEANLVARFGDSYRQYMERTGRFVPRLG
jgi:protein-S-isoprenylcysteine O-methyltransferase Ste14